MKRTFFFITLILLIISTAHPMVVSANGGENPPPTKTAPVDDTNNAEADVTNDTTQESIDEAPLDNNADEETIDETLSQESADETPVDETQPVDEQETQDDSSQPTEEVVEDTDTIPEKTAPVDDTNNAEADVTNDTTQESIDETPLDNNADEETIDETLSQESADETPVDETQPVDEQETQNDSSQPTEEVVEDTDTIPEILEKAPADTEVVILSDEGGTEPHATQTAGDILKEGDPIWCPGGVTNPQTNTNGCTTSFTSFNDLLDELETNPATYTGAGIIYVAHDYDSSQEIDDIEIDGNDLSSLTSLEIQGGWDFTTQAVNTTTPTSTFNGVSLAISNWKADILLQNITVDGSDYGLEVETTGNATLTDVNVSDTTLTDGMSIEAGGNVSFTDADSSSNEFGGASVSAGGNVIIDNSVFSDNGNYDGGSNTVTGSGLDVEATGDIDVTNTTVDGNYQGGANLEGSNITIENSTFDNNTSYGTTGVAEGYGFDATASGSVDVSNTSASNNYEYGASISATGDVTVGANSNFSNNTTDEGLDIQTDGAVTLSDVTASNNGSVGAVTDNQSTTSVTDSTFNNNGDSGLDITSTGNVTLSNVSATGNLVDGIAVSGSANLSAANLTASNNSENGFSVDGNCTTISVDGGTFSNNGFADTYGYGISAKNARISYLSSPTFSNNYSGSVKLQLDPCFYVKTTPRPAQTTSTAIQGTVNIANGDMVELLCTALKTKIITPENTSATFTDFCGYNAFVIDERREDVLNRYSNAGKPFIKGVSIMLLKDTETVTALPTDSTIQLSFELPTDDPTVEFMIMRWDGFNWVEMSDFTRVEDRIETYVDSVGIFIVVKK